MTDAPKSLRAYVDAARAQAPPTTGVTAEAVLAGVERQRRRVLARRSVAISAGLAIAASLLAVVSMSTWLAPRDASSPAPLAALEPETATERELPPPQLASAVSLRTNARVEIHGPWSIALGHGVHELAMQPTPGRALRINLPDRELELVEGHATVHVGEYGSFVELEDGVAAWIGDDGERTLISVEHTDAETDADLTTEASELGRGGPRQPSAATLAREAEAHLEAGDHDEAIALLRQLVDSHPRAGLARTGLLDLAHLLRKARRRDEARCAYALYLERWPDSPVEPEVERQLERLRGKVECEGLDPV